MKAVASVKEVGLVLVAHSDVACIPSIEHDRRNGQTVLTIVIPDDRFEHVALRDELQFVAAIASIRAIAATYDIPAEKLEAFLPTAPAALVVETKAQAFVKAVEAILGYQGGYPRSAVDEIRIALREATGAES